MNNMADRLAGVLETYRGREKLMRLLQYASFLASRGLHRVSCETTGEKFRIFAEAMSECRTVLRLFDDAAMISYARGYGTGKEVGKINKSDLDTEGSVLEWAKNNFSHICMQSGFCLTKRLYNLLNDMTDTSHANFMLRFVCIVDGPQITNEVCFSCLLFLLSVYR